MWRWAVGGRLDYHRASPGGGGDMTFPRILGNGKNIRLLHRLLDILLARLLKRALIASAGTEVIENFLTDDIAHPAAEFTALRLILEFRQLLPQALLGVQSRAVSHGLWMLL